MADKLGMNIEQLDHFFPYIVFIYGVVMTLVYHSKFLMSIAENKFPPGFYKQFQSHKLLGLICLMVGGVWSLQNLWYY